MKFTESYSEPNPTTNPILNRNPKPNPNPKPRH